MDVKLEVASGAKTGQMIPVMGEKFLIGRAEDCQLRPRSELISRYHCAIVSGDAYVGIRDLGSKNGVFVNGNRVTLETELAHGDRLTVGPLEFIVRLSIEPKAANKPKVGSVSEVVARTVAGQGDLSEDALRHGADALDIAAWLGPHSGDAPESETITTIFPAPQEESRQEMPSASQPAATASANTAPAANAAASESTSRNAASDALRKFFKGGK